MNLVHRMHGVALRLFWRIAAPGHPRGWLDLHPILDETGHFAWLHCHGMERWNLPNIEIVDVPVDLLGPAHGILLALTGYIKSEKCIRPDENIGGCFQSENQTVAHFATARRSPCTEVGHSSFLRFVDCGAPVEAGFPYRLFSAHLVAISEGYRNPRKREWFLRRATEIYPGGDEDPPTELDAATENPNNYFAWQGLGFCLVEQGRTDEGIKALKRASACWPLGGETDAKSIREAISNQQLPPPEEDPVSKFWCELDPQGERTEFLNGLSHF